MRPERRVLLMVIGAVSALTGWLLYLFVFFCRYPVPIPSLSGTMWALVLGVPAVIGALLALVFPAWQRTVSIASRPMRSVVLWAFAAILCSGVEVLARGTDALTDALSLDFVLWIGAGVVGGLCFHALRSLSGDTDEAEATALGKLRHTVGFRPTRLVKIRGVALVLDLQGFAAFFNQPWAPTSVPRYLDMIFDAISIELFGGKRFWGDGARVAPFLRPAHQKFLGDGLLFIWTPPAGRDNLSEEQRIELVRRLCSFREEFPLISAACVGPIPESFELPAQVRFGVAAGDLFELTRKHSHDKEYIGFCVNLASRLEHYCAELGLVVSARLRVPDAALAELGLTRAVSTQIKGFSREEVIVDKLAFKHLPNLIRNRLFENPDVA